MNDERVQGQLGRNFRRHPTTNPHMRTKSTEVLTRLETLKAYLLYREWDSENMIDAGWVDCKVF